MIAAWRKQIASVFQSGVRTAASALLWFFLLRAAGIGCVAFGVYLIYGTGWALIALGVSLVVASEFVRKGVIARG